MKPPSPARGAVRGRDSAAPEKLVAGNKKAYHDYEILDKMEAGLVLSGTEVKSLRAGRANLKDSYVMIERGAPVLVGCHISVYDPGSYNNHPPERVRKLLLHKRQIAVLESKIQEKGLTVVPLRLYFKGSHAKIEIGVGRGKKLHDKRDAIKGRELDREARGAMKSARGNEK